MSSLNERLTDYLRIRRQLGFELERAGRELTGFVAFLEQAGAERITNELALRWACQPGASERYHSLRLGMVRGLATLDPGIRDPARRSPLRPAETDHALPLLRAGDHRADGRC